MPVKGRPRKFDKNKALDTALRLFWKHGYEGVSISLLSREIGINTPSLYAAFGNKEALFLAAVKHYAAINGNFYHEACAKKTAKEVARHILESEVKLVTMPDYPQGCLMIQGALVTSPESEPIRKMMAEMRATAEQWMAQRFRQAKMEGDLPESADAEILACFLMTLNSGIAVQAKSGVSQTKLLVLVDLSLIHI